MRAEHEFPAYINGDSETLILGSFPSVKSRAEGFYYGHPQNRFWKVLAGVFGGEIPSTTDEKKAFLSRNKIALWDVVESCDIVGSSDASIRTAVPVELEKAVTSAPIKRIILNGRTAERLYLKFFPDFPLPAKTLPSTSPANAAWSLERLITAWSEALR